MAKAMARIKNGVVTNVEWQSDRTRETDNLKNIDSFRVRIGDTYSGNRFYRDGQMLLTPVEELQQQIAELDDAYTDGVNSI